MWDLRRNSTRSWKAIVRETIPRALIISRRAAAFIIVDEIVAVPW
jgi:hypothetical protein